MNGGLDDVLDLRTLLKRLPPDQLGLFEPVSGLMILNLSSEEFTAIAKRMEAGSSTATDVDGMRTINHEIYHFAQTVASGYMYDRQFQIFSQIDPASLTPELRHKLERGRPVSGTDEDPTSGPVNRQERASAVADLALEMDRISTLQRRAAPGDHSLAGAVFPRLFEHLRTLAAAEREVNEEGLSIHHLLEGSAVVHAELLLAGRAGIRQRVERQLAALPPAYRGAVDWTLERHRDRAFELLLPVVALALRYARPHDAYPTLLEAIAGSPEGEELARGRALSRDLPEIPRAGPLLGTAIDVHEKTAKYRVYDAILGDLDRGTWGVDSYAYLADPEAMLRVPSFPLGCLLTDGWTHTVKDAELGARMVIMSIVLKVKSRSRTELDFQRSLASWAQDFGRRMFGRSEPTGD